MTAPSPAPPELWGGVECTVNRVGDRYRDQVRLSGHHDRPEDLDLFADLGLAAIRYPVLWERTAADGWEWPDRRLARLRELRIRPIVGLVHHGSGPPHTHLLDEGFAPGLAHHAAQVAARYPWVQEWTPVNEPLTTARFAALYGHWYPHCRDDRSFWLALLNQVDAVRLSMRAIRRVIPSACLIQTDDLGRTRATPRLAQQARHDNMRRWAGWDLLFGRVGPSDPLGKLLDRHGLGDRVRAMADDPCPPDVIGLNHYLTSDRFLDHRLDRYPAHLHGGNDGTPYADTEAVRVLDPPPAGIGGALREAWRRYRTPVALTEVHNGCTREEQMRWAAEAWDAAVAARAQGVDVRAVTAWSLLGSHDWDTLLTGEGRYEPGLYDVSGGTPRPTALAQLWRGLPAGQPRHPVAHQPGWWRRPVRLLYPSHPTRERTRVEPEPAPQPLLICGAGVRARAVAGACTARGIACVFDAADEPLLADIRPWAVVDTAGAPDLERHCAARGIPCVALPDASASGAPDRAAIERTLDAILDASGPMVHAGAIIGWSGAEPVAGE